MINTTKRIHYRYLIVILITTLLSCGLLATVSTPTPAHAQAPAADAYEDNDSLAAASSIPSLITLPNLTIYPAKDPDFFRIVANPGPLSVQALATPGLDLTINVYDPSGNIAATANDPNGPNASVSLTIPTTSYYVIEVNSTTELEGFYQLQVANAAPTATATPTTTPTPAPTPTPLLTPTPALGGSPDKAEPNYDFAHAYRIAPGDVLTDLNFNSGSPGQPDNDFFVMAVRAGVRYTCRTEDLGEGLDTNLIVYYSANFNDVAGGNDDVNTQAGQINSQVTFTARADGDAYLLVGYKYPATEDLRYPGAATYTFTCQTNTPAATPAPAGNPGPGGGQTYGATPHATPLSILVLRQPEPTPTPTAMPVGTLTIDVLVAYDLNANHAAEPAEGVRGLSVRVVDTATNRELSYGSTDASGAVRFILATNNKVRVVIPFLAAAEEFHPGSPAQWTFLIPAATLPGLIP